MAIDVDVSKAMQSTTLSVEIRATRIWLLKARVWVGTQLIRLAARVMGVGTVQFKAVERE